MHSYSQLDSDAERLPTGLSRVGYDADTETYTYADDQGNTYQGEPGSRYGVISNSNNSDRNDNHERRSRFYRAPPGPAWDATHDTTSADWQYLAPFLLLVGLFLLVTLKWVFREDATERERGGVGRCPDGCVEYVVRKGDTCWKIAGEVGVKIGELVGLNGKGLDCDQLGIGQRVCVPEK